MKTLYILPNEKLDKLMVAVAALTSFGSPDLETMLAQRLPPVHVCFAELRSSFTMMADIAVIADALLALRHTPVDGLDLAALEVRWINTPDAEKNPFCDVGFFGIQAYAHKPAELTTTSDTQS